MKDGMIGFGRLGKLIARKLAKDSTLLVYDIADVKNEVEDINAKFTSLEEVCQCSVIIPFVPISEFEKVIKQISPLVAKDSLVIDVCSVKEMPAKVMQENLPNECSILATHPMFGPDSAKDTVYGCKIVLCKVRMSDEQYDNVKNYLTCHGIKVIETTPKDHDEQISHSLLLTHFIGRALMDFGANELEIDTKGYRRLMKILETVENDTWQLFEDMNKYNTHSLKVRKEFIESLQKIEDKLE